MIFEVFDEFFLVNGFFLIIKGYFFEMVIFVFLFRGLVEVREIVSYS